MQIVDSIIDYIGSKQIKRFDYDFDNDPKGLKEMYEKYLPVITKCYSEACYWHGTGRYHYEHKGESKYHSDYSDKTFDVLEAIISNKGLAPQYDFWTNITSVSLTKNRIYGRAYAAFHQFEKTPFLYEYGDAKFWFNILAIKQVFTGKLFHNIQRIIGMKTNSQFGNRFRQWAGYVRKNTTNPGINLLNFYKLQTDIPNNYGILFGIKKDSIKELGYNPTIERFETRSETPITFNLMTHIEVPLASIEKTTQMLKDNNINLQILPIELTELNLSIQGYDYCAS